MQAFAESKEQPTFHYGEHISGSAVRGDAKLIFDKIRSSVRSDPNPETLDLTRFTF
jgi:hypothetical protein